MKEIRNWWLRTFKVISTDVAIKVGLQPYDNIYGDLSNYLNCRSIWIDKKGRRYRVYELF